MVSEQADPAASADPTQDRAVRLFRFLHQLKAQQFVPVRHLERYEAVLWFHSVPELSGTHSAARSGPNDAGEWLVVPRVRLPERPPVPAELQPWVGMPTEAEFDSEPELHEDATLTLADEEGERVERASIYDNPEVFDGFDAYLAKYRGWVEERRRLEPLHLVYRQLFDMHQRAAALGEQFELVVGLGHLSWMRGSGPVSRHLVTARAELDFDARTGSMILAADPEGARPMLEQDMLDPGDQPPRTLGDQIQRTLTEIGDADIWDPLLIGPQLTSWVHSVHVEGAYEPAQTESAAGAMPQVTLAPALILRRRTERSWLNLLRNIAEQLDQSGEPVPFGVRQIVEIVEDSAEFEDAAGGVSVGGDPETYFPLPANEAQLRIIERLRTRRGVVVQGPPGTGKSHTIANLVAHLLAQGERVLVTSHTARALEVIEDKLPAEVADLCVSIVGESRKGLNRLERSVRTILDRRGAWDPEDSLVREAELRRELDGHRRRQAEATDELKTIREAETRRHESLFGRYSGTLAEIAARLAGEDEGLGWMTAAVESKPPLTDEEARELLQLLRATDDELEAAAREVVPDLAAIPDRSSFSSLVGRAAQARERADQLLAIAEPVDVGALAAATPELRHALLDALLALRRSRDELLARPEPWLPVAVSDLLAGRGRTWMGLLERTRGSLDALNPLLERVGRLRVIGAEDDRDELRHQAELLRDFFSAGGHLRSGPLRPRPQRAAARLLETVRLGGRPCSDSAAVGQFIDWVTMHEALERTEADWKPWLRAEGSPAARFDRLAEEVDLLADVLRLGPLVERAREATVPFPDIVARSWGDAAEAHRLEIAVDALEARDEAHAAVREVDDLHSRLLGLVDGPRPETLERLSGAVASWDTAEYGAALADLEAASEASKIIARRDELAGRVAVAAPAFLEWVRSDLLEDKWDERVASFEAAWNHRRARAWIAELADPERARRLRQELHACEESIQRHVAQLGAELAWRACFDRMTAEEAQHLNGYQLAMRRVGAGKGKYAHTHRHEARRHLEACQSAIPAWIMPIYRVVETVPARHDLFDVAIVDEASQSGIEALFLTYLARRIVVVGDDRQISPSNVGYSRSDVERLQGEYLSDFPLRDALGLDNSLFDQAVARFGGRIPLREHFRCMPEIISFSNQFYPVAESLVPLRQFGADRLEPLRAVHVADGYTEGGNVNRPEAEALVERILGCCSDPRYEARSMGVISLIGDRQAKLVNKLLLDRLGPDEMIARRIVCGDAYAFQGDERDVMFLSLVSASTSGRRIAALTSKDYAQRFNVAASRARDQMWLFHTATASDLNPDCYRRKLLDHFYRSQTGDGWTDLVEVPEDVRVNPFDSLFEQRVYRRIRARGYRVVAQYDVHGYRIDLVVVGGTARLAVECDGDHWHGPDRFEHDIARQRDLERCGWEFWRLRESEFALEGDEALNELWRTLDRRGIFPVGMEAVPSDPAARTQASAVEPSRPGPRASAVAAPVSLPEGGRETEGEGWGSEDSATVDNDTCADDELADKEREQRADVREVPEVGVEPFVSPAAQPPPGVPRLDSGALSLARYAAYVPARRLPDPRSAGTHHLIDALLEVVEVEGPILAERAYRIIVRAAGFRRVTRGVRSALNRAAAEAMRMGKLAEDPQTASAGQADCVLRLPNTPSVVPRERGARLFEEIPDSEVVEVMKTLVARRPRATSDQLKRDVLNVYGLVRLTAGVSSRLDLILEAAREYSGETGSGLSCSSPKDS